MPRNDLKHRFLAFCLSFLAAVAAIAPAAQGQVRAAPRETFDDRVAQAFDEKDYTLAAELLEEHLAQSPRDFIALYNAACAFCRLGDLEKAADFLYRSVESGFVDFEHMAADRDLEAIRSHPVYIRIMDLRDEAYARMAVRQMDLAREQFTGEEYRYETDEERRFNFVTALDEVSHEEMRHMLEAQADHLARTLFGASPSYFTLIAVPTPQDAHRIIRDVNIGGIYEHPRRRLVARDIGIMLRHEFTHLMHYGHMERLGQSHALWVQEGIACLYETYTMLPSGAIRVAPNQRHNLVRMLLQSNRLTPWKTLFAKTPQQFMADAGELYPQVRSIFHYLETHGKFVDWYTAYTETFDQDETGVAAFEKVFEMPLEEIERRWRTWVRVQPAVDDVVRRGDASLGVQFVEDGSNDGVLIDMVLQGSAAEEAGIQTGDVIVSFDGQPVRSHFELLIAVGAKKVGDLVPVRIRRGSEYLSLDVTLKPLR